MRQHGIAHYLDLVQAGRIDLTGMLTHTFRLEQWRDAFAAIADQGDIRRHQGRLRPALRYRQPLRGAGRAYTGFR